jgi:hypothetical protein
MAKTGVSAVKIRIQIFILFNFKHLKIETALIPESVRSQENKLRRIKVESTLSRGGQLGPQLTEKVKLIQAGSLRLLRRFAPRNDSGSKIVSGWERNRR